MPYVISLTGPSVEKLKLISVLATIRTTRPERIGIYLHVRLRTANTKQLEAIPENVQKGGNKRPSLASRQGSRQNQR